MGACNTWHNETETFTGPSRAWVSNKGIPTGLAEEHIGSPGLCSRTPGEQRTEKNRKFLYISLEEKNL